jgi:predicted O-methyltransferase YrrM
VVNFSTIRFALAATDQAHIFMCEVSTRVASKAEQKASKSNLKSNKTLRQFKLFTNQF